MNVAAAFRRPLVLVLAWSVALAAQQPATFIPPRILNAVLPAPPALTVAGGGEVLIEAIVDRSGARDASVLLGALRPMRSSCSMRYARWRFLAARASSAGTPEMPVDAPVLIAAVYRPPTMFPGTTVGEAPDDLATPQWTCVSRSPSFRPCIRRTPRMPSQWRRCCSKSRSTRLVGYGKRARLRPIRRSRARRVMR